MAPQRSDKDVRDTRARVDAAVAKLRAAFKEGRLLAKRFAPGGRGNVEKINREAAKQHRSDDLIRKQRQLADPVRGFSERELERYVAWMRKYRRAAGIGYVIKLLSIKNKRQRMALASRSFRENWTLSELRTMVTATFPENKREGRRPKIPRSREALYEDLRKRAGAWIKRCKILMEGPADQEGGVPGSELPEEVQKALAGLARAAKQLRKALEDSAAKFGRR